MMDRRVLDLDNISGQLVRQSTGFEHSLSNSFLFICLMLRGLDLECAMSDPTFLNGFRAAKVFWRCIIKKGKLWLLDSAPEKKDYKSIFKQKTKNYSCSQTASLLLAPLRSELLKFSSSCSITCGKIEF